VISSTPFLSLSALGIKFLHLVAVQLLNNRSNAHGTADLLHLSHLKKHNSRKHKSSLLFLSRWEMKAKKSRWLLQPAAGACAGGAGSDPEPPSRMPLPFLPDMPLKSVPCLFYERELAEILSRRWTWL